MALDKNDQMSGGKTAAGSKAAASSGKSSSPGGTQNQGGSSKSSSGSSSGGGKMGANSSQSGGTKSSGSKTGSNSGASKSSGSYNGGGKMGSSSSQTGGLKSSGNTSKGMGVGSGKMGPASSQAFNSPNSGLKNSISGKGSANAATGPNNYGGFSGANKRGPLGPLGEPRTGPSQLDALGIRDKTFTDPRERAVQHLMERGWTMDQARGIVGNLQVESKMNPLVGGDYMNGAYTARGIAQWRGDRLAALENEFGPFTGTGRLATSGPSVAAQLDFVDRELRGLSGYKDVGAAKVGAGFMSNPNVSPQQAARSFMQGYERPAANPAVNHIAARVANAGNLGLNGVSQPANSQMPALAGTSNLDSRIAAAIGAMPAGIASGIPQPNAAVNMAAFNNTFPGRPMQMAGGFPAAQAPNMGMAGYQSPMTGLNGMPQAPSNMNMGGYQSPMAGIGGPLGAPKDQSRIAAEQQAIGSALAAQGPGLLASPNINLGRQPPGNMNMGGYTSPMAGVGGMPVKNGFAGQIAAREGPYAGPAAGMPAATQPGYQNPGRSFQGVPSSGFPQQQIAGYQNPARSYAGIPGSGFPQDGIASAQPEDDPMDPVDPQVATTTPQPQSGGIWGAVTSGLTSVEDALKTSVNKAKPYAKMAWDNLDNPMLGIAAALAGLGGGKVKKGNSARDTREHVFGSLAGPPVQQAQQSDILALLPWEMQA